jgi:DNA polymerase I-like protein with 3'-5' exonuclease and polymerase domains
MSLDGTFHRLPGDLASYTTGDGSYAVRLARSSGTIAVDIETAGLGADSWTVKAVAIGTATKAVVLDPTVGAQRGAVRDAIAEANTILMHNSPFDAPILVKSGMMNHADVWKIRDTLVSARLAHPGERVSHKLGDVCSQYLGGGYGELKDRLEQGFKETTGKSKAQMFKLLGFGSPAYRAYAAFDVIMTARLDAAMPAAIIDRTVNGHPYKTSGDPEYLLYREQTINQMLLARSARGIEIDFRVVDQLKAEMEQVIATADKVLAGFGVDVSLSAPLMKTDAMAALDGLGMLPPRHPRLKNGLPSADKRYLAKIEHPIVEALGQRTQAERFRTDYADKLIHLSQSGRIHPQVGVLVATTGRMSYSEPPLQQFPKSVRRMMKFDVRSTSMDWSSIEPVFFANAVGETSLIEEFEGGGDLYLPVAGAAGVDRPTAKVILLAQLYGQGYRSLAAKLNVEEDEAKEVVEKVMIRMPRIKGAINTLKRVGEYNGVIQTLSGRVVPLDPDPKTGNTRYFGYKGVNYYCQGSCYDMLSEAMLSMHEHGLDDALQAAVHDEIVVATEAADDVQKIMEKPPKALCELAGREPVLRVGRVDMNRHWEAKND